MGWDGDVGGPKEGLVLAVFYLRSAVFHILQAVVEAIPQLLRGVRMLLSTEGAAPWYLHLHDLTCGAMVFFLIYDPPAPFHWLELTCVPRGEKKKKKKKKKTLFYATVEKKKKKKKKKK